MEARSKDVQHIEDLVRSVVTEVLRVRSSAPKFTHGKPFEKRIVRENRESVSARNFPETRSVGRTMPWETHSEENGLAVLSQVPSVSAVQAPSVQIAPTSSGRRLRAEDFLLEKAVVTLRDVAHLPRNVRKLIVPQTALLTPSVRDELAEQGIRLARYSAEALEALRSGTLGTQDRMRAGTLEVYALFTPYHPDSLFSAWIRSGLHPNLRSGFVCFDGLRSSMAKNETLNVLFTSRVDEALCRLNRDEKIRALSSVSPHRLEGQWKDFPTANTLIVDPSALGIYLAGQIVQRAAELFYHS